MGKSSLKDMVNGPAWGHFTVYLLRHKGLCPLAHERLQCTLAAPYPRTYESDGLLAFQKSSSHPGRMPLRRRRCTHECQPWTSFARPAPCPSRRTRAIDHAFRC
jgi:hypothetical protein